jgi:hypothetical protein
MARMIPTTRIPRCTPRTSSLIGRQGKTTSRKRISVTLDGDLYPIEAVQKAARAFLNKYHVRISLLSTGKIRVVLSSDDILAPSLSHDFLDLALLESVRLRVFLQTKALRELILGRALYQSCIRVDEDPSSSNPEEPTDQRLLKPTRPHS